LHNTLDSNQAIPLPMGKYRITKVTENILVENSSCERQGKHEIWLLMLIFLLENITNGRHQASIILLHCNVVALRTPSNRSVERLITDLHHARAPFSLNPLPSVIGCQCLFTLERIDLHNDLRNETVVCNDKSGF